jgi:hypothetical protein
MFESFCDVFQQLMRPVIARAALDALEALIVDSLVQFERWAHPKHKTSGQEHALKHALEWMRGEGSLRDAWVMWQERQMGEAKRRVHSRLHPEANLQRISALQCATGIAVQNTTTGAAARAYLRARQGHSASAYVVSVTPLISLSGERSRKGEAIELDGEEQRDIYDCLRDVAGLSNLRAEYRAAIEKGKGKRLDTDAAFREWVAQRSGTADELALVDAQKPTHARQFRRAQVKGMPFRAQEADLKTTTFARGAKVRFAGGGKDEGLVYYGEVQMFYVVEFLGAEHALVRARWYGKAAVQRDEELGLDVVKVNQSLQVVDFNLTLQVAPIDTIIGQFFWGDFIEPPPDTLPGQKRKRQAPARKRVLFDMIRTHLCDTDIVNDDEGSGSD